MGETITCQAVREGDLLEQYVAGGLPDGEKEALELHYFACDACFAELEAMRAAQGALRERAAEIRADPMARPRHWMRIAVPLALAAGLLAAAALYRRKPTEAVAPVPVARLSADYTQLAKIDPPDYRAPIMRGIPSTASARFARAMELYVKRDYAGAIDGLKSSLALDAQPVAPRFFLGACYLLTGAWDQGSHELQTVADAGDTPFRDESRMLLAKAALHRNDAAGTRRELEPLATGNGDQAPAARDLLKQMGN